MPHYPFKNNRKCTDSYRDGHSIFLFLKHYLQMKNNLLIILIFFIGTISHSQDLVQVPNEPPYSFGESYRVNDDRYVLQYYTTNTPGFYEFNGIDFLEIPFPNNPPPIGKFYLGEFNDDLYFKNGAGPYDYLFKYDGAQTLLIALPETYNKLFYVTNMNNKMYFAVEEYAEELKLMSYDGNSFETYMIPEELLGSDQFRYSSDQNVLYFRLLNNLSYFSLWSFDGNNFTHIEAPQEMYMASFEGQLNSDYLFGFWDVTSNDVLLTLYKSNDGISISEIPSPPNTSFSETLMLKEDKAYLLYEDFNTEIKALYEYDGNELSPVSLSTENQANFYIGEFNGKDFFTFFRFDGSGLHDLYSYDGNTLTLIPGPSGLSAMYYGGKTSDKLYVIYLDSNSERYLFEYQAGGTEATLVADVPQNYDLQHHVITNGNTNYYAFNTPPPNWLLFALDQSGFRQVNLDNYYLGYYNFTFQNKHYFECWNASDVSLFSLDQILNISEINDTSLNSISVFPNPIKEYLNIHFNKTDSLESTKINLFTIDGKLVDSKIYKQIEVESTIHYPTAHLSSGIYVLVVKNNLGSIQKKIIKQ